MIIKGTDKGLYGTVKVPGDKSISHRGVILGALAFGNTYIDGFLAGEDCISTINCLKQLGVNIERDGESVRIWSTGADGFKAPQKPLNVGNSGTTIRILSGVLAAQPFTTVIDGDQSIRKRPMKRVIEPLRQMGAQIFSEQGGTAPLIFTPPENGQLEGARFDLKVASAQVKSALLLAGLYTKKPVTVHEPTLSRDHTERMLKAFGVNVENNEDGSITMPLKQRLKSCKITVPGDISSAAFIMVAAAICPGSNVTIKNVGLNPTRTGIIDVMRAMGSDITIKAADNTFEPVGDITVKYSPLKATSIIKGDIIPRLIDEIPAIAVLAAKAMGTTVIKDAGELRVKESDRLSLMVKALREFGVKVEERTDGMSITGHDDMFEIPKHLDTAGDHRMAMSYAIAGLCTKGVTNFDDKDCIAVSFPGFADLLCDLGADMKEGAQ